MNCTLVPKNQSFELVLKNGRRFFLKSERGTLSAEKYSNGLKITVSGENPEWSFTAADAVLYRWRMMVYPTFYSILNVDCGWSPTAEDDQFFGSLPQKESHYHTVLYSRQEKLAVCAMFPGPVRRGGVFTFEEGKLICRWESGELQPDACYLFFDENASDSLQHIADESAKMPKPALAEKGFLGWNSWDYYLSGISEEILCCELQKMRSDDLCKDLEWFVLDEGWEDFIGDWNPNERFPSGMKNMAERIRKSGFRPGIWTAPFMADVRSRLFRENPDMFVKDSSGEFLRNNFGSMGIMGVLDPTTEKGEQFIRNLFTGLKKAGYEYFKIDFITVLGSSGGCFHKNLPVPEIVNCGLKMIRESIGDDAYLLGCGMTPGAGFGIVDSMRICPDISTYWSCILASARSLSMYSIFHNRNWVNDPDFLIVRNRKTSLEEKFNLIDFPFVPYIPFTTRTGKEIDTLNETEVWCALVILSGGALFLSDKISALNEIGRKYVETVLKYRSRTAARPLNPGDSGVPEFWLKRTPDQTLFAVFNFEDEKKTLKLPPEINGEISGRDVFRNIDLVLKDTVTIEPRSVILLSRKEKIMNTVFYESAPQSVKPQGHLQEFLNTQLDGLSGHYQEHGWPFDSNMWNGGAGAAVSPGVVYKFPAVDKGDDPQFEWWAYEQCSYLLTGLIKIAVMTGRTDLEEVCKGNLEYVFNHPDSRGVLGHATNRSSSEWAFSPFFGLVKVWYEWKKDPSIPEKLKKHFLALGSDVYSSGFRNINNLEGILTVYFWTGDKELLDLAEKTYSKHNKINALYKDSSELWFDRIASEDHFSMHGVSYAESLKLPVLLYMATGKKKYLNAAEKCLKIITERHGDISGMITCDEFLAGRDPLQGYETCVIAALGWTLGYFLMATGNCSYADRMEKIFYNAFFGAVTKEFTGLSYFSSPNQVIMAPEAQHGYGMRGSSAQRRYAADHEPHCCSGSVHRILPEFVMRMWMIKEDGSPAAVCYGPSVFSGIFKKSRYRIEEKTEYPFKDKIEFVFDVEKNLSMPFMFRIPEWCSSPEVFLNGKKISLPNLKNGFAELQRTWKNGDTLTLSVPMEPVCKKDRYWRWFEAGPIVFSLPVKAETSRDGKGKFASYIMHPAGDWNYAVPESGSDSIKLIQKPLVSDPWKNPPLELHITGYRIKGFDTLELDRFTPWLPILIRPAGEPEMLTLVPFGSTLLRLTAFPDGVRRELCPVYGVWVSEPFPCNEEIPLEKQIFLPEQVPFLTFRDQAKMIPPTSTEFYDFREQICRQDNVVAYAAVMFYADRAGDAVIALGASSGAVCNLNGKNVGTLEPFSDAELMAPACFPVKVRKGYNELLLKVPKFKKPLQFRNLWGFKVHVYLENKKDN